MNSQRGVFVPLDRSGPGIQFGTRNPHQAAGCIDPDRVKVVFDRPVSPIAWQPMFRCQRNEATVFQPAKPPFCRSPKRTVRFDPKIIDASRSQTVGRGVRFLGTAILEIEQAASKKSDPQAAVQSISSESISKRALT